MSAVLVDRQPVYAALMSPVRAVMILLLWGIFAIKLPPLFMLGLALGLMLMHMQSATHKAMDRISLLILLNIAYWLLSGFLIGGLNLSMMVVPSYYSNEGRIFLSYLPFLILSCCAISDATLRSAIAQMRIMALLCLPLFVVWAATKTALLSVGKGHNFAAFMTSHTGSGTFFSELCVFLVIYGRNVASRPTQWLGYAMLLPVLGSGSRESLVALVAVLAWYLRRQLTIRTTISAAVLLAAFIGAMPYIAPHTYERTSQLVSPQTYRDIEAQVLSGSAANWEPGQDKDLSGEEFNILSRILYWSYAVKRIADSPFLGDGFGRFNDRYVHFEGERGLWYFGVSAQNSPATLHAHNSYLMIACETGLLGLLLLLAVWYALWRRMTQAMRTHAREPEVYGYLEAMQGLIVFVLFAALFGHALGAPTDAIPVLTLLGLGAGYLRTRQREASASVPLTAMEHRA